MANDDMRDSLVLAALRQLSDDDAARHLAEVADFHDAFRSVLTDMSDLVQGLQLQAFARKHPDAGDPDPTWQAWAAWAEVARLREVTAAMEHTDG